MINESFSACKVHHEVIKSIHIIHTNTPKLSDQIYCWSILVRNKLQISLIHYYVCPELFDPFLAYKSNVIHKRVSEALLREVEFLKREFVGCISIWNDQLADFYIFANSNFAFKSMISHYPASCICSRNIGLQK